MVDMLFLVFLFFLKYNVFVFGKFIVLFIDVMLYIIMYIKNVYKKVVYFRYNLIFVCYELWKVYGKCLMIFKLVIICIF